MGPGRASSGCGNSVPMNNRTRLFGLACMSAISLFALISACDRGGGSGSAKILKLAFVTNNSNDFWKIAAAGVRKYEGEAKVQVDVKNPRDGTPAEQNQILENLSSQRYEGIARCAIPPHDHIR